MERCNTETVNEACTSCPSRKGNSIFNYLWMGLLALFLFGGTANAQDQIVSGQITDTEGKPLVGASVLAKGTTNGTATDGKGNYSLNVPEGADSLRISYVGFTTKVVAINGRSDIDIKLRNRSLEEVVVTALGVEREEKSLGYAVQKVDGSSLDKAKETNVVNSISGKAAGVNVNATSAGPSSSSNITIRGSNSISGNNQALFLVNGMPITNGLNAPGDGLNGSTTIDFGNAASLLNPDDIESINVLKGPTAAALYGTRASNGVVLVKTKNGEGTEGFGVSVNSSTTFESVLKLPNYQNKYGGGKEGKYTYLDGTQYTNGYYDAFGESWGPRMDGKMVKQWEDEEPTPFTPAEDNIRDFFNTGVTFTNNIAITNSTKNSDLRLSYTNKDQEGIVPNTGLERHTFYASIGNDITEDLSVRGNFSFINGSSRNVPNAGYDESSSIMYGWLWYPRHEEIGQLKNYWADRPTQQNHFESLWTNNPYFLVNENTNSYERNRFIGNVRVNYDLTDNFSLRWRSGGDINDEGRQFRRAFSTRKLPFGSYRKDELNFMETNHELLMTYSQRPEDSDFGFEVNLGGNRMHQSSDISRSRARDLSEPGVYNLSNARGNVIAEDFTQEKEINSIFGLASIDYKGTYFLDITGRNDWSSTLPTDNNSYFYPSISGSAIVSDMLNVPNSSPISFAKVRASYAEVGGDTDPYNTRNFFRYGNNWGGQPVASESATLNNPNLKPEQTVTYEVGADVRLFDGALGLDVTYYDIQSKDQIINVPVAASTGYDSRFINAGEIQNQGVEIMLNASPIQNDNGFSWSFNINYGQNTSEVVSLTEGINNYQLASDMYPADGGADLSFEAREGKEFGQLVGKGLKRVEDGQYEGEIIHEDGLPVETDEKVSAGSYQPDFRLGVSNTLSYKNLSLNFLIDGQVGGQIYSRTHTMLATGGAITNEDDEDIGKTLEGRGDYTPQYVEEDGEVVVEKDDQGNPVYVENEAPSGYTGDGVKNVGTEENPEYVPNDVTVPTRDYFYQYYGNGFNRDIVTTGTYDATFFKLREVTLTYQFPDSWFKNNIVQDAAFSLVGRNLVLWTQVPSIDPETYSIRNGRIIQGYESTQLPSTRSYGFNISVKF